MSDARVLGAILNAPAALSGLNDAEFNLLRDRARSALHPEQHALQQGLARALDDLQKGVAAARRLVCERCQLRVDR
jgi:hypothetical protein